MLIEIKENEQIIRIIQKAVEQEFKKSGLLRFLREIAYKEAEKEIKKLSLDYDKYGALNKRLNGFGSRIGHMRILFEKISAKGLTEQITDVFHTWQKTHTSFEDRLKRLEMEMSGRKKIMEAKNEKNN